ncbi:MAG: NusG domain II-containing protein [Firmicutes bacterium]|nr:NusG domain II-containing protein [Bacillota bacterium]
MLKKYDKLIILLCIAGFFFSLAGILRTKPASFIEIKTPAETKRYNLQDQDITVKGALGDTVVIVRDSRVRVADSSCPDKWCRESGWIDKGGESIICLPNKVVVSIKSESGQREKVDAITF